MTEKFKHYFNKIFSLLGYVTGLFCFTFVFNWPLTVSLAVFAAIITAVLGSSLFLAYKDVSKQRALHVSICDDNIVAANLRDAMQAWYNEENYGDVITFGRALGRALYISACYKTRIEIGELVKTAAQHHNDSLLLTQVLLDDLGWTKFLCGASDGEKDINDAIEIAEKNEYYKEMSKGYRHLMAIELSKWTNPSLAESYLNDAFDAYNRMTDGHEKDVVLSGLIYAKAELLFKQRNFTAAKQKSRESEEKRKALNEQDRHVRFYSQYGKIEYFDPHGNIEEAEKIFLSGIRESEISMRIDEITKNSYGYACCLIKRGYSQKAKTTISNLIEKYGKIPLYSEDETLRKEYENLSAIKNQK